MMHTFSRTVGSHVTTPLDTPTAAALLTACSLGVSISLLGALLPTIQPTIGLQDAQVGVVQSIFFLGHLLGIIATGPLMGRWTCGRIQLLAVVTLTLGMGLSATDYFEQLVFARILTGFGLSMSVVVISTRLVQQYSERGPAMLSLFHAVIAASAAMGLLLLPVVSEMVGWKRTIGLATLLCIAPLVFVLLTSDRSRLKKESRCVERPTKSTDNIAKVLLYALIVAAYVSTEQIVTAFLPLLLSQSFPPVFAAQITGFFWIGIIAGRIAGIYIRRRAHWFVVLGGAMMTISLLAMCISTNPVVISIFAFCAGTAGGPLVPLGFGLASQATPHSSRAILCCQVACFVGGFLGPTMIGQIANRVGLNPWLLMGFAFAPVIGSLALASYSFFAHRVAHRQSKRTRSTAPPVAQPQLASMEALVAEQAA